MRNKADTGRQGDYGAVVSMGGSLVVQHPRGGLALELLLLQDAVKVLHALLRVLHVRREVAVEEADGVPEHRHAGADPALVPLGGARQRRVKERRKGEMDGCNRGGGKEGGDDKER